MRFRITVLFAIMTVVAIIVGGVTLICSLDPFPINEFTGITGTRAAPRINWRYSVSPTLIKSVSHKSQQSIDSYSSWTSYELPKNVADQLVGEIHQDFANFDEYSLRNYTIEQRSRAIHDIPIVSPTGTVPNWWNTMIGLPGVATENMLFSNGNDWGTAQGCYTIYDFGTQKLWVYQYACQGDSLWKRGMETNLGLP